MYETLADAVAHLDSPERGFHFAPSALDNTNKCDAISYRDIKKRAQSLALKYWSVDAKPKDTVVLMFADQREFIHAFLSAICAGLVVAPVAPPNLTESPEDYTHRVERIRKITNAKFILTSEIFVSVLQPLFSNTKLITLSEIDRSDEQGKLPQLKGSDLALVQFTSGSTAAPKGVAITHSNLVANAEAIKQALAVNPEMDRGVSWLPMHHDMGLIGFLVTPVLCQTSIWYLAPLDFARRPQRWLDLMHEVKATISIAPNFGYDLVTRRLKNEEVTKWDLSHWRVAGCGGEPVKPNVLHSFYELLKDTGFNSKAFAPSYGLAEATLAVTMSPLNIGVSTHQSTYQDQKEKTLVSSGKTVSCAEIRIVSTEGTPLPDGCEGEIQVKGPAVAEFFWTEKGICKACDSEGWLSTGDLGILHKGNLHVSGRIKEVVALNGCKYHPHDIEECALNIEGIKRGKIVAFGRPSASSEQLVIMIETYSPENSDEIKRKVRTRIREKLGLSVADVVTVGRGNISRTTSGKLQRSKIREQYLAKSG